MKIWKESFTLGDEENKKHEKLFFNEFSWDFEKSLTAKTEIFTWKIIQRSEHEVFML